MTTVATAAASPDALATYTASTGAREEKQDALPFFAVATHKFVAMSLVTIGLYQYYWFYKQWRCVARAAPREPMSPFWRTFFTPLFAFSLFARIGARAELEKLTPGWNDVVLGIAYLLLSSSWRLPEPWWLISLLAFAPVIPVQRTIDAINRRHASGPLPNRNYSGSNVVGIIVGGGILLLVVIGVLFGSPPPAR